MAGSSWTRTTGRSIPSRGPRQPVQRGRGTSSRPPSSSQGERLTAEQVGERQLVLDARGISKRFGGVVALGDVSLDVWAGEVHCLVGQNGCGKSTLIKILSGVVSPDAGTITVGGVGHRQMTPRQAIDAGIQVIFQDFSLFPSLSVAENIAIPSYVADGRWIVRPAAGRRIAREVVDRVGIDLDLDAPVADLTVADRQLTAICRALARDPRIIFLDEPTTALTWREVDALFRIRGVAEGARCRARIRQSQDRGGLPDLGAHHRDAQRSRCRARCRRRIRPRDPDSRDDWPFDRRLKAHKREGGAHDALTQGGWFESPWALCGRSHSRSSRARFSD